MINRDHPFFTNKPELVNSLLHSLGILFGIISVPMLIWAATESGHRGAVIGSIVYGISFLMVFTFSTLFHGCHEPRLREIFKIMDHISIYFLIAGSYTPLILMFVYNDTGITLLFILWGLTLVGTVLKIWFTNRFNLLSTGIYILMGWMLIFVGNTFFVSLPATVTTLIVIGGGLYSFGVIFYLWERYRYNHAVWHICVLAAGICHFAAVWTAVA